MRRNWHILDLFLLKFFVIVEVPGTLELICCMHYSWVYVNDPITDQRQNDSIVQLTCFSLKIFELSSSKHSLLIRRFCLGWAQRLAQT
ncbi:hypothetical protein M758_10G011300 [Ceratodon purpureus]|nr:hypothetical protein M758_10G011300 [Ceratodon purpureus]